MRTRALRATLAAAVVSAVSLSQLTVPVASADEAIKKISISNITDFHGRFEYVEDEKNPAKSIPGAERLKCAIDKAAGERKDSHILTSSGDNIGASPFAAMLLDDAPTIEVLNQMGLRASAVGNHEFDKGASDLSERVIPDAQFTYLGANAETVPGLEPYSIEEIDGVKVAFIGTVTDDMPNLVSPAGIAGITWTNPLEKTNALAQQLKAEKKADVVVALIHEGGISANQLDKSVDVAFLGHTHQYVSPERKDTPLVLQAGDYSRALANVNMSVNTATGDVTVEDYRLVPQAEILACDTKYPEIAATVDAALAEAGEEGSKVVAKTTMDFTRGSDPGKGPGSNRGVESTLNNLLADAARWSIDANSNVTPDIGVMNAGGVRNDLPAGDITYEQAFSVQPFGNENTYVTLKGKHFKEALEQQWQPEGDRKRLALGLSNNVSYTYNPAAEQGNRITSVIIDGQPMDPEKDYIVAGSTFLLQGGDRFNAFTKGSEPSSIGLIDVDAFIQYLKAHKDLTPRGQSAVGVKTTDVAPGKEATIDLSSLIYSGEDSAKTVTVSLEDVNGKKLTETSADIDPKHEDPGFGEIGKASVKLPIPADAKGDLRLRITTDAKTDVYLPITLEGGQKDGSADDGSSEGDSSKDGSSDGGSADKPKDDSADQPKDGSSDKAKNGSSALSPRVQGALAALGAFSGIAVLVAFALPALRSQMSSIVTKMS